MCHAMPFLARALKKNIFFDVNVVVKNKSKCGLSWSVLLPTTSMYHYSFPKHFYLHCFCILSEFVKVSERKVWRLQAANLHNAARALFKFESVFFSCQDKYLFRYLWYCVKKTNRMWFRWTVLLSTTIRVITVVKMLCNKLSYITKRALCFSYWVRQQHTPMGK